MKRSIVRPRIPRRQLRNRGSEGLLGDTPARNYTRKLQLFSAFAKREFLSVIAGLELQPGMRVLDAGCGAGQALEWLRDAVTDSGSVTGIDLSEAHVAAARSLALANVQVIHGNILDAPPHADSFDLVWCVNTINHLHDPVHGAAKLGSMLRPGGRLAIAQSSFLPDMFFAWDARLERVTNDAVRQYYRSRYRLDERDLTSIRAVAGFLRSANFRNVAARTVMIERLSPLDYDTEIYLREAVFRDTWGERLRPYMSAEDCGELEYLCDCNGPGFALRRPDFHLIQSLTTVVGEI